MSGSLALSLRRSPSKPARTPLEPGASLPTRRLRGLANFSASGMVNGNSPQAGAPWSKEHRLIALLPYAKYRRALRLRMQPASRPGSADRRAGKPPEDPA
ncbi:MAG: hypothetical protein AMXMBFR45_03540 [Gammaproteobacteria bacterium]|nr:MAG: hypothetical protein BroJett010_26210 [Gammaproteobacteria bacterium]